MLRFALRAAGVVVASLAVLLALAALRALRLPSRQLRVAPAPARSFDADLAARHLSEAIRIRTISWSTDPERLEAAAFARFRNWLAAAYPRLHAGLSRELVSGHAILYTWKGRDPALDPLLLMAHQDVVPADRPERWSHPPFAGQIDGGFVWGRGAVDDKGPLVAICEAVEALLGEGYAPRRTVMLAFGHDEEVGGPEGAVRTAELLRARGIRPGLVLDEGMALIEPGMVPGLERLLAPIGIAEKGSATLELVARAAGGHSSTPPRSTAAGILARAIARLEDEPMPLSVGGATGAFFEHVAPELPLWARIPVANLSLVAAPLDSLIRS
jgi:carboxypeptidase PM20D1